MKNCELAEFGLDARAIETVPRTCGSALNSALRSGYFDPPVPVPVRAAGLGHEAVDHAVKDDAVIEALGDEPLDMGDVTRREGRDSFR